ncbi:MAG TPA: ABC transporter permease [Thermoanaerobaculia bacterium]|nr:ABC transporter permease [Thermoanaerobaculia bacterium]
MIARPARRLYIWLLGLYPRRFRERYGEQMAELFSEMLAEAEGRGRLEVLRLAFLGLLDGAQRVVVERRRETRASRRGESAMTGWTNDFRHAFRGFSRQPGTTVLVVAMLALGVAATTAVFALFNGIFLRPLPFPDSGRLVYLNETAPKWNLEFVGINYPDFVVWRDQTTTFESMATLQGASFNLSAGERTERIQGAVVTHDLLAVLGVEPALGRAFTVEEDSPGGPAVAMLGYTLWQDWFAGDSSIVGSTIRLDSKPHVVVGVLPAGLRFPTAASLWLPLRGDPAQPYQSYGGDGIGRLRPSVTLDEARADLLRAQETVWADHDQERTVSPLLLPLRDRAVSDYRRLTLVLAAGVCVVLLIACANVASITLARTIARRGEIGLRLALGVTGRRLARQLFTESLLLSVAGGALGVLLGAGATRWVATHAGEQLPVWARFDFDARVAVFAIAVSALTTVLFGWAPVVQARRCDLRSSLDARGRAGGQGAGVGTLDALVVAEIALASLLLVGGGLVLRGLERLRNVDPGWVAEGVLSFRLSLPAAKYQGADATLAFYEQLLEQLQALPGVDSAGAVTCPPLGCHLGHFFEAEGAAPPPPEAPNPVVLRRVATPGYLETLRIPLVAGRTFDVTDRAGSRRVVVVNESFVRQFFEEGTDPVGRRVRYQERGTDDQESWLEVIGVTQDIQHYGLDRPMIAATYEPLAQAAVSSLAVMLRTAGSPTDLLEPARRIVRELDPELPLYEVGALSDALARSLALRRLHSWLVSLFAAIALVLAAGGTYGVISYGVTQRRREIGIRSALGASRGRVLGELVGHGLRPVVAGMLVGFVGAALLGRTLSASLFGIDAADPLTFVVVAALLLSAGLIAAAIPARRAVSLDPSVTLREE